MKKLMMIAALASVTACSKPDAAPTEAATEAAAATPAATTAENIAADGKPSVGKFKVTSHDGKVYMEEDKADGTYVGMMDGKVVYGCTVLAIDAVGRKIETLESLTPKSGKAHPIIQAFVNNDAQQCGYCTPGFVMASKAFLDKNPNPTYEDVKKGLGGNLCRCGTYMGIRKAVLEAAQELKTGGNRA